MSTILRHRLLADPIRARLLDLLAATDRPLAVRDLATAVGRHPNSVRDQLEHLVDGGLVARVVAPTGGRGRPPHRYRLVRPIEARTTSEQASGPAPDGSSPEAAAYEALARVLAEALAHAGGGAAAEAAGEAWGAALVGRTARRTEPGRARRRLVAILDRAGFDPEPSADPAAPIDLRRCPFVALARERREVVCSAHLGMLRGALRAMAAPVRAIALEPFVRPDLCRVHLAPTPTGAPPASGDG